MALVSLILQPSLVDIVLFLSPLLLALSLMLFWPQSRFTILPKGVSSEAVVKVTQAPSCNKKATESLEDEVEVRMQSRLAEDLCEGLNREVSLDLQAAVEEDLLESISC